MIFTASTILCTVLFIISTVMCLIDSMHFFQLNSYRFDTHTKWLKENTKKYYLQNFVDSGNLIDCNVEGVSKEEMKKMLEAIKEYIPTAEIRGL